MAYIPVKSLLKWLLPGRFLVILLSMGGSGEDVSCRLPVSEAAGDLLMDFALGADEDLNLAHSTKVWLNFAFTPSVIIQPLLIKPSRTVCRLRDFAMGIGMIQILPASSTVWNRIILATSPFSSISIKMTISGQDDGLIFHLFIGQRIS